MEKPMTEKIIAVMMLIIAVIHLIPVMGVLGAARLETLYGISINTPELEILMRHRAVMFGILGAFFVYAAFVPFLQPIAFLAAAATLIPFFYLAFSVGGYGQAINKILVGDAVALVALIVAVALYYLRGS